ncbi:chemotaxis protein CheA [Fulvivirga lutimaris]|uniref:chemotaxis protein CheA n=1 Tax=Fulvivirga lutimaris TaxID=1819566 RepID=UPI0012BC561A|nr:chemotaxis protein CheA [Fulvivirga lutimaris]MTI39888.1 chemotaxis protein CheA [Fulvivirga lutimaris]
MDFQQEYITEVKQILKSLEQSMMVLAQDANNPDEIDNAYRYLHTVKGSAGMFDYHLMENLTHELEYVYSDIRDGIRTVDEYILDLTLHAIDVLNDLIEGNNDEKAVDKLIKSIKELRGDSAGESSEATAASGSSTKKEEAYIIIFQPNENIFKRGVNLAAILEDIADLGEHDIIFHNESVPFEKQLENKAIISWLEILLITDQGEEGINDVFMFLNNDEYSSFKVDGAESFASENYKGLLELKEADINDRIEKFEALAPEIFTSTEAAEEVDETEKSLDTILNAEIEDEESEVVIKKSKKGATHVNVDTQKLDGLINIVSELVTFRSEIQHLLSDQKSVQIQEAVEKLDFLTLKLRDSAFNIRLVPINILNVKLQRLIRSVSKELGKEVDFITEGLDTELDRSIITALEAPLMHIIRNSLDHGIESPEERVKRNKPEKGLLKLYSYNSGDHVFIQIQDDGNGLNFKKIQEKGIEKGLLSKGQKYSEKDLVNVMMSPGFSTADAVTTVSGRGVGMDVVKKEINALRGDIEVSTEEGLGTIITLRLPLTLTILDTLVVNVGEEKYLIPINEIETCIEENHSELFRKKSRQIKLDDQLVPFVSLREYFGREDFPEKEVVIVVNKNDTKIAVVVDSIIGQYQTVYKPLNELLQDIDCFSGASILGDGSTALILNALKLKN